MSELKIEPDGSVWDLVAEFLERRERGEAVDPNAFVRAHPDVADRLRECLAGFQWMEATTRPDEAAEHESLPREFGNYELQRVIGRGGMGCVYEAVHRPLGRQVALKLLPPHMTHVREFRLRFLREARVVASLHHTNIAPVFEVGQIGNTLYLAMPLLSGPNLRELVLPPLLDEPPATAAVRAKLPRPFTAAYFRWIADVGVQASDALAHAHSRGVIHRDMKPSNLLIDEHGAIWVVDFGLAKADTHPVLSVPGELIGTLRYASPEQIHGEQPDVRTDVYGLGVTLYELLTRRPAFPPGPGHQVLTHEPLAPRRVSSRVPRDLETIVTRAMSKRPQDRYPSAAALADDLRRFLRDEPIRARPIGPVGRFIRVCRRNPALSSVITVFVVLLSALVVFDRHRLAAQRDEMEKTARVADERYAELLTLEAEETIASNKPWKSAAAIELIREAAKIRFRPELWELAIRAADQIEVTAGGVLENSSGPLLAIALDASGSELVGSGPAGVVDIWSQFGKEHRSLAGFGEPIVALARSPVADIYALLSPDRAWIARENRSARKLENARAISGRWTAAAFSPDGRFVALAGDTLGVWNVGTGELVWPSSEPALEVGAARPYHAVCWSPDGNVLATLPRDEAKIEFWKMPQGEPLPAIPLDGIEGGNLLTGPPVGPIAFAPDGLQLACGCADGTVRIFSRSTGSLEHTLRGHEGAVHWLAYTTPNGWLVSADAHEVRVWDVTRDQPLGTLVKISDTLVACSIDAAGRVLTALGPSGTPALWRISASRLHQVVGPEPRRITALATSRDARWLAWAADQWGVSLTDAALRSPPVEFDSGLRGVQLAFSPDGKTLCMAGQGDPPIRLRSLPGGETRSIASGAPSVSAAAFVSGSERLATAHADGSVIIWNLQSGKPSAMLRVGPIKSLAASADGKWLAAGGRGGDLHLWETASMTHTKVPAAHDLAIWKLAFSPDGNLIASAGQDGRLCNWRVPDLTREFTLEDSSGPIGDVCFGLDGSTIVSCSTDGKVILWSRDQRERVAVLTGRFTGRFDVLTVTADGRRVIAGGGPRQLGVSGPGGLEIWDLGTLHRAALDAGLPDWREVAGTRK